MGDPDRLLSSEEVAALLSAVGETGPAVDFSRPESPPQAFFDAAALLHEPFLRESEALLSEALRHPVRWRPGPHAWNRAGDLLAGLSPGSAVIVAGEADRLIALDPGLAFAIVERGLGGRMAASPPDRPPRDVEWKLLMPWAVKLAGALDRCWGTAESRIIEQAVPGAVRSVPLGPSWWAIPLAADPDMRLVVAASGTVLRRILGERGRLPSRGTGEEPSGPVARWPLHVLFLEDLARLAPGDLLLTGLSPSAPVAVEAGPGAPLCGRLGVLNGRKAVEVAGGAVRDEGRPLVRRPGGGAPSRPANAESVPIEVRAVLSEAAGVPTPLRPGSLVPLGPSDPGRVKLVAGPVRLADGQVIRAGDRRAVRLIRADGLR